MEKRFSRVVLTAFILTGILGSYLLSGCSSAGKELEGDERDAVIAYSEPMTDDLLASLNANEYATFVKDFSPSMTSSMTSDQFDQLYATVIGSLGNYLSREVQSVQSKDEYTIVLYNAKFENADDALIRVVFDAAEPHQVAGLWFDSDKLPE